MDRIIKIVIVSISLLILLFLLLLPYINSLCVFRVKVKQRAQFNCVQSALELFNDENNGYPPSEALDPTGQPYCGAMKLCEAMRGQDFKGFNKESVFRSDGMNESGIDKLYGKDVLYVLNVRMPPLLHNENVNAYHLNEIYKDVRSFEGNKYVLCDTYLKKRHSGKRTGMPILYYKANTSNTEHDVNNPDNPKNIYNYKDNHALLSLGVPGKPNKKHPLFVNPKIFYEMTKDRNVTVKSKPVREDSYILISAGKDGLYGTADDISNFQRIRSVMENLGKTEK
jgi:hypothetical protein